jgi:hypothetical protein
MARIFEGSLIEDCVDSFQGYLRSCHLREGGPGNTPLGLYDALMMWLLDGDAFDAVGDSYELFLRMVIAVIMFSNLEPTLFSCQGSDGRRDLLLHIVENDDMVWLDPAYFRLQLYRHQHKAPCCSETTNI